VSLVETDRPAELWFRPEALPSERKARLGLKGAGKIDRSPRQSQRANGSAQRCGLDTHEDGEHHKMETGQGFR